MGAAYLAGLAVGYWKNIDEIKENWSIDRIFSPEITHQESVNKKKTWKKAVKCAFDWAK